jgi:hypothetical protein
MFGKQQGLNCTIKSKSVEDGCAIVTVTVSDGKRTVEEIGAVDITERLTRGDALKKAITQARRRGFLAFCGFSPDIDNDDRTIPAETFDPPLDVLQQGGLPARSNQPKEVAAVVVEPIEKVEVFPDGVFDREMALVGIDQEMARISMTRKSAVAYLKATFQKATRDELNDEEMLEFLKYLEEQPSPIVEVN